MRPDHDEYFMDMAKHAATRATCIRHNVGCIIVDASQKVIATGYNGAPPNLPHCLDVGCIRDKEGIPSGEKQEYCYGVHAEQNALIQAEDRDKLAASTLYCTHTPCLMCIKMILSAKILRVVHGGEYPLSWLGSKLIEQSGILFQEYSHELHRIKSWPKYGSNVPS